MNKRKSSSGVEPRKEPKQERSRQTYQVILQGAIRVIRRDGIQKLSTNKVAEESGVSIGSLYQYFPSKQAVIAALIDQVLEAEYQSCKDDLAIFQPKSGAREFFKAFFGRYYRGTTEDMPLKKAIVESIPIVDKNDVALTFHKKVTDMVIEYVQEHYKAQVKDYKTSSFILKYATRAVASSSIDKDLEELDMDRFLTELSEMMMYHLGVPAEYQDPQD